MGKKTAKPAVAKNPTRTIENSKVKEEFCAIPSTLTVGNELPPKVLITTARRSRKATITFAEELSDVFPGASFETRGSLDKVKDVSSDAAALSYTHLIVVGESRKEPDSLAVICLPSGPTFFFKLSSVKLAGHIHNHGRSSCHSPELILNNMETSLGRLVGSLLIGLFPPPEFKGRQVVTFHNQRDFIFFRRHRYIFDDTEMRKVRIQEIGPQFTLKLRRVSKGIYDPSSKDPIFDDSRTNKIRKEKSAISSSSANNKIFML